MRSKSPFSQRFFVGLSLTGGLTGCLRLLGVEYDPKARPEDAGVTFDATSSADSAVADPPITPTSVRLAVGPEHICGVTPAGALRCWGRRSAALGLGPGDPTVVEPTDVAGITGVVTWVATTRAATCAIAGGKTYCWGKVLDGTTTSNDRPMEKTDLLPSRALAISSLTRHACSLGVNGAVCCWGTDTRGELGSENTAVGSTPLLSGVMEAGVAVSLGAVFSCALANQEVQCWGDNSAGALGKSYEALQASHRPNKISFAGRTAGNVSLAAGFDFVCALATDASVWCWGSHYDGALGAAGTRATASRAAKYLETPVPIEGLPSDVASIAAGAHHICALTRRGSVWCWGKNDHRQLGASVTGATSEMPVEIANLDPVREIAATDARTCVRTEDDRVFCFGDDAPNPTAEKRL